MCAGCGHGEMQKLESLGISSTFFFARRCCLRSVVFAYAYTNNVIYVRRAKFAVRSSVALGFGCEQAKNESFKIFTVFSYQPKKVLVTVFVRAFFHVDGGRVC